MRRIIRLVGLLFLFFPLLAGAQHPVIGDYSVYFGNLHNHTRFSDGEGTPYDAFHTARYVAGLDFFAVTDHGEFLSLKEWDAVAKAANMYNEKGLFVAIRGFEWSSYKEGHLVVLGTSDYCSSLLSRTSSFDEVIPWIEQRRAIAFFCHPGDFDSFGTEFYHFKSNPSERIVGMELWNGSSGFEKYYFNDGYYSDDDGLGYFDEALTRGWKTGAAGAEDVHDRNWGAGEFRLAVLSMELSGDSILSALNKRRFYSTLDKNLLMSFRVNGNEMGSTIPAGDMPCLVMLDDADDEFFTMLKVIKNGREVKSFSLYETNPLINFTINASAGDYYYVLAIQEDNDMAISSPVFFESSTPTYLPETVGEGRLRVIALPGNRFVIEGIEDLSGKDIILTDMTGRIAGSFSLEDDGDMLVDLSHLLPGAYILHVSGEPGLGGYKIIIR